MNFKLFTVSSMYQGYLESFYDRFKDNVDLSYQELHKLLLNDTTEFIGSYTRTFNKLGIEAECVIANDVVLQNKWRSENISKSDNDKDILTEQVKRNQPDILSIENISFTDKDWLQNIRSTVKSIKLIIAYHCSPFSPKIIERLKHVDFLITCTPGLKQEMENNGIRSYLVYHGFDTDLIKRITINNKLPKNDLVFSGSLTSGADFHGERTELIESLLRENIDIALYVNLENKYKIKTKQALYRINEIFKKVGLDNLQKQIPILRYGIKPVKNYSDLLLKKNQPSVYGIDMYNLLSNSRIVLNMHIGVAGNFAGNMRLFEATGVGSCLLTDNKKNIDDLFDVNKEVVVYNNPKDCIEKAKWLLKNESERKKIADAGQQKTLKMHTVENRCKLILEIIDKELNQRVLSI
jgi:spore maturation protein CgeB